MADYSAIARELGRVRRAWRRTAALSGLAVVVLEAAGMLALMLLVDLLYEPGLPGRLAMLAASGLALAYLAARHVVSPLARRIPDEQVALFVEERNPAFEGALLAAAEFGRTGGAGALTRAILEEAAARAARLDLRSAVDTRRLRKYAAAAAAVVASYLILGGLAPDATAARAARVLAPWRRGPGPADGPRDERAGEEDLPIEIRLSAGDTELLRGSPFELEATLSRRAREAVLFLFRPLAAGPPEDFEQVSWRSLQMKELDRLGGYAVLLPDVNEDLEFRVECGPHRSSTHRLTVYDPLRIEFLEIVTRFPEYLGLQESVERPPTGDVRVPEGSRVTLRIATNGALAGGELEWSDGKTQAFTVERGSSAAEASFDVTTDRAYTFVLRDVHGQEVRSSSPALVHAVRDSPPRLAVKSPKLDLAVHPLAEVDFLAEASDDWGVASVELVYTRGEEEAAQPARMALALSPARPTGQESGGRATVTAAGTLLLERLRPPLGPGELVTYHLECRDRKGQSAVSDVYLLSIAPFEVWATWLPVAAEAGGGVEYVPAPLAKYLAAAWHLHATKDELSREEYEAACKKLADEFVSGGVTLWEHVSTPPKRQR